MKHDLTLIAQGVRLVPLGYEHAPELHAMVDDSLWAGLSTPMPRTLLDMERHVVAAWESAGRYAFAVVDDETGEVRGSTSYYDVARTHERAEIGHTFFGRPWWGGKTNPTTKYALLRHAFEDWGLHRVALRADTRNARSIAAIVRLGATAEGVLRGHRIAPDGTRADSLSFSILAPEWPAAREGLLRRLEG